MRLALVKSTNWVFVVKIQHCLNKSLSTFNQFLFHCHFINFSSKFIILLKPKTLRREYLNEIVRIILALCEAGRLYTQIAGQIKIPQLSVVHIIHKTTCTQNKPYYLIKQACRLPKLDIWAWQTLICHMKQNPYDNLAALGILSKLSITLGCKTIQVYLKTIGYLWFKAPKTFIWQENIKKLAYIERVSIWDKY